MRKIIEILSHEKFSQFPQSSLLAYFMRHFQSTIVQMHNNPHTVSDFHEYKFLHKNQLIFWWYSIFRETRFSTVKSLILGPICRVYDTILIISRITWYAAYRTLLVLLFLKIAHPITKVLKVMLTVIIFVEFLNKTELTDYRSGPNRSWWSIFMNRVKCVTIIDVLIEFKESLKLVQKLN